MNTLLPSNDCTKSNTNVIFGVEEEEEEEEEQAEEEEKREIQ